MKRTALPSALKPLLVALLACSSLAAHADIALLPSVNLYGLVDTGYASTNNTGKNANANTSGAVDSILGVSSVGLRGEKDWGNGLTGFYNLQVGFLPSSGKLSNTDVLFSRNAYVGVRNELGSLSVGRQWVFADDWLVGSVFKGGYNAGAVFKFSEFDAVSDLYRNTLKYVSPVFGGGAQVGAMYAKKIGESVSAGSTDNSSLSNIGARYSQGPWMVAATYLQEKGISGGSYKLVTAGGAYDFAPFKLRLGYTHNDIEAGSYQSIGTMLVDNKAYAVNTGVDYAITGKLNLALDYLIRRNTTFDEHSTVNRLLLTYAWRPDLTLVGNLASIRNSGTATQTLVGDTPLSGGHSQTSMAAGVRFSF